MQMLAALVAKLAVAQSTLLISSLLLVVARLVHLHLPELVACLAAMPAPDGAPPPRQQRLCATAHIHS